MQQSMRKEIQKNEIQVLWKNQEEKEKSV